MLLKVLREKGVIPPSVPNSIGAEIVNSTVCWKRFGVYHQIRGGSVAMSPAGYSRVHLIETSPLPICVPS